MMISFLLIFGTVTIALGFPTKLREIDTYRVPLRFDDPDSPYCFAAASSTKLREGNFLATQVWPSARVASEMLIRNLDPSMTVCELACGPGLPSITAARLGSPRVVATDIEPLALEMVGAAAREQGLLVETEMFDLGSTFSPPVADLYILSDAFESQYVASGAAHVCARLVSNGAMVWVFAQQDRAQREIFLHELRQFLSDPTINWYVAPDGIIPPGCQLWLEDVDELQVNYG